MKTNRSKAQQAARTMDLDQPGIDVESPRGAVTRKALSFGDFVASVYGLCGERRARGVVQRAVNTRAIVFQGRQRFVVY